MREALKPIPKFRDEADERAFWESHDSTDYLDCEQAEHAVLSNLKPTTKTIAFPNTSLTS